MDNNVKAFITVIIILIVGVIGLAVLRNSDSSPAGNGQYDGFAQCIKDSGTVFYGAFWCPHCQNQKKLFGSSAKYLPYVECSTADGAGQLAECREKNITGYPLWEFANGERLGGELSLETLAEKTSCVLPTVTQ